MEGPPFIDVFQHFRIGRPRSRPQLEPPVICQHEQNVRTGAVPTKRLTRGTLRSLDRHAPRPAIAVAEMHAHVHKIIKKDTVLLLQSPTEPIGAVLRSGSIFGLACFLFFRRLAYS